MLYKEDRLNKRENTTQAMAAQFKRFQKDQKNSRSSSRSSRASGSTPTTNPKYEGVRTKPKCPTYNNSGRHQPKQCWTLHPNRRPQQSKDQKAERELAKKQKKATVATAAGGGGSKKPDDLPNQQNLSMLARMANQETRMAISYQTDPDELEDYQDFDSDISSIDIRQNLKLLAINSLEQLKLPIIVTTYADFTPNLGSKSTSEDVVISTISQAVNVGA